MSNFNCKSCGRSVDAIRGMPPRKCPHCDATQGFAKAKKPLASVQPMQRKPAAPGDSKTTTPGVEQLPSSVKKLQKPSGNTPTGNQTQAAGKPGQKSANPKTGTRSLPTAKPRPLAPPTRRKPDVRAPESKTATPAGPGSSPLKTPTSKTKAPQSEAVKPVKPVVTVKTEAAAAPAVNDPAPVTSASIPPKQATSVGPTKSSEPARPPEDTRVVWTFESPNGAAALPQRSSPAVDDRPRMFACFGSRLIMFMDPGSGQLEQRWEYATGDTIPGPPVIDSIGNIRVHSRDGLLHVVNPSGEPVHDPAPAGEPLNNAAPVVDSDNSTWICRAEGGLSRIIADGTADSKPFLRTRQRLDSAGVIAGGVFYAGGENGCVYAIDLTASRGQNSWDHSLNLGRTGWYIHSALAATPGGDIVVASNDDILYCFNPQGEERWKTPMGAKMLGSPVIDERGHVYIGLGIDQRGSDGKGALVCLSTDAGRIIWRVETSGRVESTPVIGSDGVIYFGDNASQIHAVTSAGKLQWSQHVAARVRSGGTIVSPHLLVFGLDDERLVGLRCSSSGLAQSGWPKLLGAGWQRGWPPN